MEARFNELKTRLIEINDLNAASAVLGWDQMTYMPPGGAPARARQLATLQKLAHEMLIAFGDEPRGATHRLNHIQLAARLVSLSGDGGKGQPAAGRPGKPVVGEPLPLGRGLGIVGDGDR